MQGFGSVCILRFFHEMSPPDPFTTSLLSAETREKAFESAVRRYSPRLYTVIRHIVKWHDDADDVLQNTWLRAWRSLDTFRGESSFYTWLYRIAIHESVTYVNRRNQEVWSEEKPEEMLARTPGDPFMDGDELQLRLERAVSQLPARQQLVFRLRYYEERPYEEISRMLEVSEGALKASYHIAVKKLEQFFYDWN